MAYHHTMDVELLSAVRLTADALMTGSVMGVTCTNKIMIGLDIV